MNEVAAIKENEVAVIGTDYGIFAEYIFHNHTNPITSRFKEIDFSTWDEFLHSFYDVGNQPDILDISYKQATKDFASFEATLKSYGLLVSKSDSRESLTLTRNAYGFHSKTPVLKFSGKIFLQNNLIIENMSVVFDEVSFFYMHKIHIKNTSPYDTIVYMRNTYASHIEFDSISSLWISGSANLDSASFKSWDGSSFGTSCNINIAPDSMIMVQGALDIKEISCINIGGALQSYTNINVAFANEGGEFFLKSNALLRALLGKLTVRLAPKVTAVNNGIIEAQAIDYGAESLYNNGTIFVKKIGTISVTKLFNYKAGRLISDNKLTVKTIKAFYNIGEIKTPDFTVSAPNPDLPSGIIYNDGIINITSKFKITSKTHFLNYKNGVIRSGNKLYCQLIMDWFNMEYSKDALNVGNVNAKSANVDLHSISNLHSSFKIDETITGTVQRINCINSKCEAGFNLKNPLDIYVKDSQTTLRLENGQKIREVVIGDLPQQTIPALPASLDTPNYVTNSPIISSNSSLHLTGNATIEALFIGQRGKFIVGDELKNLTSNIAINSLYMLEDAMLVTTNNGQVFVGTMVNDGGQIESLGNVTVSAWNLQGNVTLKGNINGPATTEQVNLILNNAYLAIDVDMFNKGLSTIIGDSMTILNAFIRGIISGKVILESKTLKSLMKTALGMVVKFVGSHQFTDTKITSQPKIDLKEIFELDIDKTAAIDGNSITKDKIKIKSGNKVIILPTSLYKKIYSYLDNATYFKTTGTISSLVSELTGENGIEIFSEAGIMLYSWKYKSNLPIILNAGEIVSTGGKTESSKINYYTSWLKKFCDLVKKVLVKV